ncbi:MAG: hypothetical protein AAGE18_17380 [Pseudomonadota bacterium]
MSRLLGAVSRGFLVIVVLSAPAFLLPSVSQAAQEISLVIGGLAALFTIFEYASSHPGLVDFRFAPPYNRSRFFALAAIVLLLTFYCRAIAGPAPETSPILELANRAAAVLDQPLSPVRMAVGFVGEGESPRFQEVIRQATALAHLVALIAVLMFGLTLWIFRWPTGRAKFNLWVNLPTFAPSTGRDVERRLKRDGLANILVGLALPYVIVLLATRSGGWFDPRVLVNFQPLIWGVTFWAFIPAALVIRGAALLKVGWLVQKSRAV